MEFRFMKRRSLISLSLFPLALAIFACGGAGDLISGAEATLSATPTPVAPGAPITVTWGGNKLTRGKSNDFGAPSASMGGTITDKTAVSLTYHYSAYGQNGDNPEIQLDATATVVVTKSTKSVCIFGDPAAAGTNQVADFMRGITTGTVRIDDGSGSTAPTEDLIVYHPSIAGLIQPGYVAAAIAPWLHNGKSIMVIGETTLRALGESSNLSSVGGYFGGANGFSNGIFATEKVRSGDGLVPLSVKYRGQNVTGEAAGGHGVTGVDGSADILISSSAGAEAFVYPVASGGKTAFAMHDGVGSTATDAYYAWAIQSMARWCLDL